jgi:hypothetical protein
MKTPIHVIVTRMKRLPLHHQIAHLRALVANEKPRSFYRIELEALLKERMLRQIRKEGRAA